MKKIGAILLIGVLIVGGYTGYRYYGKTQVMDYERTDKNPQPLEPNAYIEATISKKRIIQSPVKIDKKEIPEKAFAQLNNRKTTSDN